MTSPLLALLLCSLPLLPGAQEPNPTPAEGERIAPPQTPEQAPGSAPIVDRPTLEPGVLPADTSARARELWQALIERNQGPEPIQAFDLAFFIRHRSQDGRQSNDLEARYRFLRPGFVRVSLPSGREHLRGPRGDFLLDAGEAQPLTTRTHVEDRRQLDEAVATARNFLSLTDPARLRITRLRALDAPPFGLPPELGAALEGLVWLEITSPDFHLVGREVPQTARARAAAAASPPLFRTAIGVGADQQVELAVIHEEQAGALALGPSTMLVDLEGHTQIDGYRVPRLLRIHEVDLEQSPWAFRPRAATELFLKPESVGLRPKLAPEQFLP